MADEEEGAFFTCSQPNQITAVVVERLCYEFLLSRHNTTCHSSSGVLFTAPAAPTLAVQLDGCGRGPPPSVTAAAIRCCCCCCFS